MKINGLQTGHLQPSNFSITYTVVVCAPRVLMQGRWKKRKAAAGLPHSKKLAILPRTDCSWQVKFVQKKLKEN
jgi:hypothetical protein